MTMTYRENDRDRDLCSASRMYKGQRIDVRWSGGWLTPDGTYYPVDYRQGVTHETLADEHGSKIHGSGSISTRPPMLRLFDFAGWMRITHFHPSSFCVEFRGILADSYTDEEFQKQQEIDRLMRAYQLRREGPIKRLLKRLFARAAPPDEEVSGARSQRQATLLRFIRDYKNFDGYFLNNEQLSTYRQFVTAIRDGQARRI